MSTITTDAIRAGRCGRVLSLLYNMGCPADALASRPRHPDGQAIDRFEVFAAAVKSSRIIDVGHATWWYGGYGDISDAPVALAVNIRPVAPRVFLDCTPTHYVTKGGPRGWGWLVEHLDLEQLARGLLPHGAEPHADASFGVLMQLAIAVDTADGAIGVVAPVITVLAQCSLSGAMVCPPLPGFPIAVDPKLFYDFNAVRSFATQCTLPALFAASVLNAWTSALTKITPSKSGKPSKRRKYTYERLNATETFAYLRNRSAIEVIGLTNAMEACSHLFGISRFQCPIPPHGTILDPGAPT